MHFWMLYGGESAMDIKDNDLLGRASQLEQEFEYHVSVLR